VRHVLLLVLIAALSSGVVPARAAETGLVVTASSDYVPGDSNIKLPNGAGSVSPPVDTLLHLRGNDLRYVNLDLGTHTVTSKATAGGKPLFDTKPLQFGQEQLVTGVPALGVGRYPFYCVLHPDMQGVLVVIS